MCVGVCVEVCVCTRARLRLGNVVLVAARVAASAMPPSAPPSAEARAERLERAVRRHGDVSAMIELGNLLLMEPSFHAERQRGWQMLERAVKHADHPFAMLLLACHLVQQPGRRHHSRAFALLQRSLQLQPSAHALVMLSACLLDGVGTSSDADLAVQLSHRAFRLEQDPLTIRILALSLLNSPRHRSHTKRAVSLFRRAINLSDDPDTINELAELYHFGHTNLPKCPKRAEKWYNRAIQTAQYPPSMRNLAILILERQPTAPADVRSAVDLLEQALNLHQHHQSDDQKEKETVLQLAQLYSHRSINVYRSFDLYQYAAIRFKSQRAVEALRTAYVQGIAGKHLHPSHVFHFCSRAHRKALNFSAYNICASMLWTGAHNVPRSRNEALSTLNAPCNHVPRYLSKLLLLRHHLHSRSQWRHMAQPLMHTFHQRLDTSNLHDLEAIILSESDSEQHKLIALRSFRSQQARKCASPDIVWLAPFLRKSRYALPFHGHPQCFTDPLRTFTTWPNLVALNLATLLLELDGKQHEALPVLQQLMLTDVRLIAALNLAFILNSNIKGVHRDRAKALALLQDAVRETNDASARVMLSNALLEGKHPDRGDVARALGLLRDVENEICDERELEKIRRLFPIGIQAHRYNAWPYIEKPDNEGKPAEISLSSNEGRL